MRVFLHRGTVSLMSAIIAATLLAGCTPPLQDEYGEGYSSTTTGEYDYYGEMPPGTTGGYYQQGDYPVSTTGGYYSRYREPGERHYSSVKPIYETNEGCRSPTQSRYAPIGTTSSNYPYDRVPASPSSRYNSSRYDQAPAGTTAPAPSYRSYPPRTVQLPVPSSVRPAYSLPTTSPRSAASSQGFTSPTQPSEHTVILTVMTNDQMIRIAGNSAFDPEYVLRLDDLSPPITDEQLQAVRHLQGIRQIYLGGDHLLTSRILESLEGHESVEAITVCSLKIDASVLTSLQTFPNLRELHIGIPRAATNSVSHSSGIDCRQLDQLAELTKLEKLSYRGHIALDDLEIFGQMQQLRELSLDIVCDGFTPSHELEYLSELRRLERLEILGPNFAPGCPGLFTLTPLPRLRELSIPRLGEGAINQLERFPALRCLKLQSATEEDLPEIAKLKKLEQFTCNNMIGDESLAQLTGLKRLKTLELHSLEGLSLESLRKMPKLEVVRIDAKNRFPAIILNDLALRGIYTGRTRIDY